MPKLPARIRRMSGRSIERILVVEDEVDVASALRRAFEPLDYRVDLAFDGRDGLERALSGEYALVVLDIMLPTTNGLEICVRLRKEEVWTPILMLTAKSGDLDQAESLDAGADDYLTKPVSMAVLVAHVRAILRRAKLFDSRNLVAGGMRLDSIRRRCSDGGTEIELSARETEVLAYLMLHKDVIVSKNELIVGVWGSDFHGDSNIVEVYVRHLRRKLEGPFGRRIIDTFRGSGYQLRSEADTA